MFGWCLDLTPLCLKRIVRPLSPHKLIRQDEARTFLSLHHVRSKYYLLAWSLRLPSVVILDVSSEAEPTEIICHEDEERLRRARVFEAALVSGSRGDFLSAMSVSRVGAFIILFVGVSGLNASTWKELRCKCVLPRPSRAEISQVESVMSAISVSVRIFRNSCALWGSNFGDWLWLIAEISPDWPKLTVSQEFVDAPCGGSMDLLKRLAGVGPRASYLLIKFLADISFVSRFEVCEL